MTGHGTLSFMFYPAVFIKKSKNLEAKSKTKEIG
jgi:hypothetical protein